MEECFPVQLLNALASLPLRGTPQSAGLDLSAAIEGPVTLAPGETVPIGTGLAIELPQGSVGLVFGRSGLGVRHGLCPANGVGVIDADYRGEVIVGLYNHGAAPYTLKPGERIAQLVILPCLMLTPVVVKELSDTQRGSGGFASTGR